MAKIVIAGSGTLGDHIPLVGLGRELARRGHAMVMAINPAMRHVAERAGLEVAEIGSALGPNEARDAAVDWDHWTVEPTDAWRWGAESDALLLDSCLGLIAACAGADLLIAPANDLSGWLVHERIGIPWATVALTPAMILGQIAADRVASDADDMETMPAYYRSQAEHVSRVRQRLGLVSRPLARQLRGGISSRLLVASNATMAGVVGDEVPTASLTGFWLPDDDVQNGWEPTDALSAFMARGHNEPRPLALSFSSLPLADPATVLAVHARAAALVGRRLIVLRGWAGFSSAQLPPDVRADDVFFADALPHDWLFSRVDAACVHGGIGSLARALRAGCPVVVEPYGNDQFFNARQVLLLGLGAAMHPHRVTPAGLARVLTEKVLTSECRTRVERVGREIAAEDGLTRAADMVCAWLPALPTWDRSVVASCAALS